jgi:DNA recombination protein RmuC
VLLGFSGVFMQVASTLTNLLLTGLMQTVAAIEPDVTAPLITGKALYLWTGAGAVIVVLVLLLVLLGRWRSGRKAREIAQNTEFFQPAGDDAEITFDEKTAAADADYEDYDAANDAPSEEILDTAAPKQKRSPFSALFSRKEKSGARPAEFEPIDDIEDSTHLASVEIEHDAAAAPANWDEIERQDKERAEAEARAGAHEREEREQRRQEDAAREQRFRAAEEDRRRADRDAAARADELERARHQATSETMRFSEPQSHAAHDDIVRTLSEVEEALHAQREAIQAETRTLLDSFARRFSDRIDALATSVEQRSMQRLADSASLQPGHDSQLIEQIARRLDDHRSEVSEALNELARRIDAVGAKSETSALREEMTRLRLSLTSAGSPSAPSAPAVQLSDIVRNALAPGAYEFNAVLSNNRRADCLIRLARPPGPIAIDAHFPVEAFHALHGSEGKAAENEFRRLALRHIVGIAERLIAPGFTADSAMLFLPSESMAAEIHARFPDIVQDSYRARVWIVSPTTLMATLHTMSAFLRDAPAREPVDGAARRALAEVERLSERIAALEIDAGRKGADPLDILSPSEQTGWRGEQDKPPRRILQPAADNDSGNLIADDDAERGVVENAPGNETPQRTASPPFPLR